MKPTFPHFVLLLAASVSLRSAPPDFAPGGEVAAAAVASAARAAEQKRQDQAAIYDALQRGEVGVALGKIRSRPVEAGGAAEAVVAEELGSAALTALNRSDSATASLAANEALQRLGLKQITGWSRRSERTSGHRLRALLLERALGRPEDAAEAWQGVLTESPGDAQATRALKLIEERARLRRIRSEELARDPLTRAYRPSPSTQP